ncbi:MAG: FAD-dependent monooxygenase [Hyphomicrobiales bacterium]|nr:FAD-dependent monooxygenase [Hyphomicrobiales bacterium]
MRAHRCDIAIVGGGPAGAFGAILLARAGYATTLVDSDTSPDRIEGLSPRVVDIFHRHKLDPAMLEIGPRLPRRSLWSGTADAGNGEHIVSRQHFDRALRRAAVAAGVDLLTARAERLMAVETGGSVLLADGDRVEARLVIEARGRRAPVAAGRLRGPATISLAGYTRVEPGAVIGTIVIPVPEGWIWCVDDGEGKRWLQLNVDASAITDAGSTGALCRQMLGRDRVVEAIGMTDPDFAPALSRAADSVLIAPELDPVLPRIGDAAVSLDPLSGHGMFFAISSALAMVPIVDAILNGDAEAIAYARRFYDDRVVGTFFRQARVGRDFYRLEERHADEPFWAKRRDFPDLEPAHGDIADAAIRTAIVVENNRLVEREVLITPDHPGGVARVAGVPIVPAMRQLAAAETSFQDTDRPLLSGADHAQTAAVIAWLAERELADGAAARPFEGGRKV